MDKVNIAAVPLTAWEQAAIVVLFCLCIWGILAYIGRQDNARRKQEDQRNKELMAFIERRDRDWQGFLREVRESDVKRHDETQNTINRNAIQAGVVMGEIAKLLEHHDNYAHSEMSRVQEKLDALQPRRRWTDKKYSSPPPTAE